MNMSETLIFISALLYELDLLACQVILKVFRIHLWEENCSLFVHRAST